jgi:hypothetical protein
MADTVATTTEATATSPATTAAAATATKKAKAWKTRGYVTNKDIRQLVSSRRAEGKNTNVGAFLERQLAKGIGVGAKAVGKYAQGAYTTTARNLLGNPYGIETPNLGGMRGLGMQPGQVYMGAAQQGGSIRSSRNYGLVNLTRSGQPARTANYVPILKLKKDFKTAQGAQSTTAQTPAVQ